MCWPESARSASHSQSPAAVMARSWGQAGPMLGGSTAAKNGPGRLPTPAHRATRRTNYPPQPAAGDAAVGPLPNGTPVAQASTYGLGNLFGVTSDGYVVCGDNGDTWVAPVSGSDGGAPIRLIPNTYNNYVAGTVVFAWGEKTLVV